MINMSLGENNFLSRKKKVAFVNNFIPTIYGMQIILVLFRFADSRTSLAGDNSNTSNLLSYETYYLLILYLAEFYYYAVWLSQPVCCLGSLSE